MRVPNEQDNVSHINNTEKKGKNNVNNQIEEEFTEDLYAITPPNGGWGWLVVLSALYCNIVVDGIQLTFGIFLKPISKSFDSPSSEVSLAGSLMFGAHLLLGPLCAGCNSVFGLRPVTITGSLICCFGVGISYFSNGYVFLCFSFGLIGGVGLGLVYMNTLVITSLYFTTMLPVAIGIVVCGSGLGIMIFTGLGSVLLKITTWRNSFLMEAALAGSMGLAAIVFRPLKPIKVKLSPSTSVWSEEKNASTSRKKNSIFVKTEISSRTSLSSIATLQDLAWNIAAQNVAAVNLEEKKKERCACSKCCRKKKYTAENKIVIKLTEINSQNESLRRNTYIEKDFVTKPEQTRKAVQQGTAAQPKSIYKRIEITKKKAKDKIWTPLKMTMTAVLDCTLLRSLSFFLFTLSGAIQVAAQLVIFIYEKGRAEDLGFGENMSVIFLLTLGGTSVFWRLVLGIFTAFVKVNFKIFLIIGIILGGIITMCSGFFTNIYYEFVFCFFFSLAMATSAVFRVVIMVDLVGIERVATGTGINLLFMGVFCIIFPPVFGLIMEATNSYQILFSITGGLVLLSGLLLIRIGKVKLKQSSSTA